ncbi:uncharacterized protein DSM5745_06803 [Aspergillus mulundensis]|uniref:Uncharacterized protein n=1 Tax=Aspergillus mulundensis TaxID=1810919 RepID=A0A3D8RSL9_9EURO|nr:hypothetical protein DSM5745_06803 [Aspergillus mulundensis]RDW76811.1 hypothetical protein DSM5745_06803 [Aspergillus mulundensis]
MSYQRPYSSPYTPSPSPPHLSTILNLYPDAEPYCAGYAPSQGRRCHMRTNARGRSLALSLLNEATKDIRAGYIPDEDLLFTLAHATLCTRFHQNQAPTLVARWKGAIECFFDKQGAPPATEYDAGGQQWFEDCISGRRKMDSLDELESFTRALLYPDFAPTPTTRRSGGASGVSVSRRIPAPARFGLQPTARRTSASRAQTESGNSLVRETGAPPAPTQRRAISNHFEIGCPGYKDIRSSASTGHSLRREKNWTEPLSHHGTWDTFSVHASLKQYISQSPFTNEPDEPDEPDDHDNNYYDNHYHHDDDNDDNDDDDNNDPDSIKCLCTIASPFAVYPYLLTRDSKSTPSFCSCSCSRSCFHLGYYYYYQWADTPVRPQLRSDFHRSSEDTRALYPSQTAPGRG